MEIRLVRESEMADAVRLSDSVFRDSGQVSMGAAFPDAFSSSLSQSFGAFEDGKPVSFMGLVPSEIRIGPSRLRVFSLGSVCTHPDYRGRELASGVLSRVMEHVDRSGADLMLVSGDRSLYLRNRCCRFGSVIRYTLTPALAAACLEGASVRAPGTRFREFAATDWFGLKEAADSRSVCYEQSLKELADLITNEAYASCLKMRHAVWVAERDDKIAAFAVVAVPKERLANKRTPFAVEWGGEPDDVLCLLAHAMSSGGFGQLDIPVPAHESGWAERLADAPRQSERNLGTVYIPDPERLMARLAPYLQDKDKEAFRKLQIRNLPDGACSLHWDGRPAAELDAAGFASLLFDANPATDTVNEWPEYLARLFPIAFPYAGGLHYV